MLSAPTNPNFEIAGRVWFNRHQSLIRSIGKAAFLVLASAYFALCYGARPFFLKLPLYVQGLERTPYQYRVLPMYAFRILLKSTLIVHAANQFSIFGHDPYHLIVIGIAFFAMLGALIATGQTITRLTGDAVYGFWSAMLVVAMSQIQLASAWAGFTLPYDVPALFFFCVSIYLIVAHKSGLFYLVFPFAVLNRETACFISMFFAIWEWVRLSGTGQSSTTRLYRIAPHIAVQIVIWVGIKTYLAKVYAANPVEGSSKFGGLFTTNFPYNLHEILKPQQWPVLMSVCGFTLPFLFIHRKWIRCDGLFYACAIILPIYFAAMMVVGIIVEVRIFTEWIALAAPTLALVVHNRFAPVKELDGTDSATQPTGFRPETPLHPAD